MTLSPALDLCPSFFSELPEHRREHCGSRAECAHDQGDPSKPGSIAEPGEEI